MKESDLIFYNCDGEEVEIPNHKMFKSEVHKHKKVFIHRDDTEEVEMKISETFKSPMLNVNEMFCSISGEIGDIPQGQLITVLRLQGCNLNCSYCDAPSSQEIGNNDMLIDVVDVANDINKVGLPLLITGGEPLLQRASITELFKLLKSIPVIQIETNGTIDPPHSFTAQRETIVSIVMDYKFDHPPTWDRIKYLDRSDYLKFVISSVGELTRTCYILGQYADLETNFAISATDINLYPDIIEAIKHTNNKILTNVQIHKYIGVQ